MTPSRIALATSRLIAQCLNQLLLPSSRFGQFVLNCVFCTCICTEHSVASCRWLIAAGGTCCNHTRPIVWLAGRILLRDVGKHWQYKFVLLASCWSQWPLGPGCRFAAARLLRLWVRIPPGAWMFVVNVMCCQVEVCAMSWSLVERSPTDCGACLWVIQRSPTDCDASLYVI